MPTRRTRRTPRYQGVFGQSLFGGSGAGTPQQFQSTPYQGNSLTGSYQHAYDQARAQNENRYNRILGGYGELLGQPSPYQAQRMNVHDLYNRRAGDIHANLVGRGLTAGTVGMAPQALSERERQFSLADIGDKEARYKSDIAQDQLDFMERKTESHPDYEQLERLSQGLGAGGRGLGGGSRRSNRHPRLFQGRSFRNLRASGSSGSYRVGRGRSVPHKTVYTGGGGGIAFAGGYNPGFMMTAANLRGPHQYGGSYQERRGGGAQRGGAPMDEMSYIRQARREGYSVDEARQLYPLYQEQQASQGAQRGMTRDQQNRFSRRQGQQERRAGRVHARLNPPEPNPFLGGAQMIPPGFNPAYWDPFAEDPVSEYYGGLDMAAAKPGGRGLWMGSSINGFPTSNYRQLRK